MKKFLEPEIMVVNLDQETILLASTESTPKEGNGYEEFDITKI